MGGLHHRHWKGPLQSLKKGNVFQCYFLENSGNSVKNQKKIYYNYYRTNKNYTMCGNEKWKVE